VSAQSRVVPALVALVALLAAVFGPLGTKPVRGLDAHAFLALPVLEGGRVKPLDSVARNALLVLRSKQSARLEGRTVGPDEWALDVLFRPRTADAMQSFVIDDPEVLGVLGLAASAERYYSFTAIAPKIEELEKQAQLAARVEAPERSRFQRAALTLYERVVTYHRLRNSVELMGSMGLAGEIARLRGVPGIDTSALEGHAEELAQLAYFRPLPPLAGQPKDAWKSVGEALVAGGDHPALPHLAVLAHAYREGHAEAFAAALGNYRKVLEELAPEAVAQASREELFNRMQPFFGGMWMYVLACVLVFVSWIWKPEALRPVAFAVLVAAASLHTAGLVARVALQGRPPVTNLYSSAVFVGWGAVLLGIFLERTHRRGFGTAVASGIGFSTLLIAHHLASSGDTMEMMRAVLDSNFWLATHVVIITIGYSATFLAGAIAIGYAIRKHVGAPLEPAAARDLLSMVYGVVSFALLFSFVGTVLGGIWADQSWGRFWGWDPKENGALLIVLWNAILLHARREGYVRERGIMAMAIFGNVITSFSWFGVNMLGVGLHSYGFMDSAFQALAAFMLTQLALIGVCLAPRRDEGAGDGAANAR
jgi:ABC-type transport system involved in cytochrome c biogenesis permease subunit